MSNTEQITTPADNLNEAQPTQQAVLDSMNVIFQMQQQQLSIQEQMMHLMAQFIPND